MQNFKEAAISAADQMIEALEHEKRSLNHKIFSRERTLIHVSVPVSHINSSLLSLRKSKERVWNNFFFGNYFVVHPCPQSDLCVYKYVKYFQHDITKTSMHKHKTPDFLLSGMRRPQALLSSSHLDC